MGYIAGIDLDPEQTHEGWVAMTYADGKISSGTSSSEGHYLDGYTFLPSDPNDTRTWGIIDPAYLRSDDQVTGWIPRCECGWRGIEVPLPESACAAAYPDPSDEQESLVMDQWRLHLRYDVTPERPTIAEWAEATTAEWAEATTGSWSA